MTFQDFLMNSPSGGLMIKVGDGTPIGGLPPWIASDTVNGGLMFKVNAAGYTPPDGMLQTTAALSSSLQVVKDNLGNSSGLALATNYARFGVSGFWFITFNNSISHSAGNPLNINSDFGAITMGSGTITSNGLLTIKGAGSNILSLRDSSNVEKVSVTASGAGTFASSITSSSGISNFNQIQITGANIFFAAKSVIASPVDGNLSLQNNAGNSFSLLQLGGTTSSFPAIKRNATGIDFRLADDSANTNITCSYIIANNGTSQIGTIRTSYLNDSTNAVTAIEIINTTGALKINGATNNAQVNIKGSGSNILSLRNSSNVEKVFVSDTGELGAIVLYCQNIGGSNGGAPLSLFNYSGLLQLNGTTSSFPAIKRNGAAIDFRLADDSNYAVITAAEGSKLGLITFDTNGSGRGRIYGVEQIAAQSSNGIRIVASQDSANINATAILQVDSTTKGFLMPRMTNAQILLIATPANGLQVYNTDLAQPCFYDGAGWRKISHTNM